MDNNEICTWNWITISVRFAIKTLIQLLQILNGVMLTAYIWFIVTEKVGIVDDKNIADSLQRNQS